LFFLVGFRRVDSHPSRHDERHPNQRNVTTTRSIDLLGLRKNDRTWFQQK
jgi:hypothetical protein